MVEAHAHTVLESELPPMIRVDAGARTVVAIRPFLLNGVMKLSVVAKVTLDISQQGPARWIDPEPIVLRDRPPRAPDYVSLDRASDLALAKRAADVTLVGSVVAPYGASAPSLTGHFALYRNGETLFDRSVVARGALDAHGQPTLVASSPIVWEDAFGGASAPREVALANPVGSARPRLVDPEKPHRPGCFAPLGAHWPARVQRLSPRDRESLESGLPEIDEAFDWGYFQAAPFEQQLDHLSGDEWILIEGMSAQIPSLRSRLPWMRAQGFVVDRSGARPIGLALDTLAIDAGRLEASLVWRGVVSPHLALDELAIVTRVSSGSQAPIDHDLRGALTTARPQALAMPRATRAKLHATMAAPPRAPENAGAPFALGTPARAPAMSPPPWREARASVVPATEGAKTMALDAVSMMAAAGIAPPMPFRAPIVPAPLPVVARPPERIVDLEPLEPPMEARELTPPSRAALAADVLRESGLSEDVIRQIMGDFEHHGRA